jgi:hypothetical protein
LICVCYSLSLAVPIRPTSLAPSPPITGQVQDSVGSNAAISKDIIYPLFDRLGTLQTALVEELRLLVVRQRLYEEATSMLGGYTSMLPSQVKVKSKANHQAVNPWTSKLQVPSAAEQEANARIQSTPLDVGPYIIGLNISPALDIGMLLHVIIHVQRGLVYMLSRCSYAYAYAAWSSVALYLTPHTLGGALTSRGLRIHQYTSRPV